MLTNKKILLCVTGGIAAFKAAALTSKLVQQGAEVKVILSKAGAEFVTPLTFQALSQNETYTDTFDERAPEKITHIGLADWADLVLVAPATANTIGKLANGIADNLLTTTILATKAPVFIATAMNSNMIENKAVLRNLATLVRDGYHLLDADAGYLACGYTGKGRMQEPEEIIAKLAAFSGATDAVLTGKKLLITAGPTIEKLDPVRYLSNFSSGKMGYALAGQAVQMGAEVVLVSGPVNMDPPAGVQLIQVMSAADMHQAVMKHYHACDCAIASAAVADYTPIYHAEKIKKRDEELLVQLNKTTDILLAMGQAKTKQYLVGFAAETENVAENAIGKLEKKHADMLIANDVTKAGAGFGTDTNIVTIYQREADPLSLPLMTKTAVANEILQIIARRLR